jgi:hypothetical protein
VLVLRQDLRFFLGFFLRSTLLASILTVAAGGPAWAQGKLEARYTVSLAGIPIGEGSWQVDVSDTQYTAAVTGLTVGLMRVFTGGEGNSTVRGTLQAGLPLSSIYAATITSHKKTDEVRLSINNGDVKEYKIEPPQDNPGERLPITEAHQHGVLDPMTASLLRTPGTGDLLAPETCNHTAAIFDGRLRYDLKLAFKRLDKVRAKIGYAGPVLVCSVYFSPVAGYVPSRYAIKYIAKLRDIEVWLAPIAGTRILAPIRAEGPSPIGLVVMEATQFVSVASPTRASANGSKTQ